MIRTTNLSQRLNMDLGDIPLEDPSTSPYDERKEDQENEAFFRAVQEPGGASRARGSTLASGSSNNNSNSNEPHQPLKVESVKKYYQHAAELEQKQQGGKEQALQPSERAPRLASVTESPEKPKPRGITLVESALSGNKDHGGSSFGDEREERRLPEDIYSLIYTANIFSQAFFFALFVFLIQETLLLLILFDEINFWNESDNMWQIPPGVPVRVNVAQAISMVLVVSSILGESGDLPNGLGRLVDGYHVKVLLKNPHASFGKWFMASIMQASVGVTMAVVLFFLVMQSTTVLDLALNFAALSFVMDVDNVTFQMAKEGFLSRKIQKSCQQVVQHWEPKKNEARANAFKSFMVFVMLAGLFVPYGFLVHAQWDSRYVCKKVFIQFKDQGIPYLSYYSGNFHLHELENELFGGFKARIDSRVFYHDESETLKLAYCAKEMAWTISLSEVNDQCLYLYKSTSPTDTFDVTTLGSLPWQAWSFEQKRTVPVDLFMTCNDCQDGPRGNCHGHNGVCIDNECQCFENNTGITCQHILPGCEHLQLDARGNLFPSEEGGHFSDQFEILRYPDSHKVFLAHERPVYVAYYSMTPPDNTTTITTSNVTDTGEFDSRGVDILFFNGRRWVVLARDHHHFINKYSNRRLERGEHGRNAGLYSVYEGEIDFDNDHDRAHQRRLHKDDPHEGAMRVEYAIMDVFGSENEFDQKVLPLALNLTELLQIAYDVPIEDLSDQFYRPFFFSEAVEPLSEADTLDPVGLDWYRAHRASSHLMSQWSHDESRNLGSIFLCADCHWWSNRCMNSGSCNETTTKCECGEYYTGALCERELTCHEKGSCQNNGTCEVWKDYCTCPDNYFGTLCQYSTLKSFAEILPVPN